MPPTMNPVGGGHAPDWACMSWCRAHGALPRGILWEGAMPPTVNPVGGGHAPDRACTVLVSRAWRAPTGSQWRWRARWR
jgi:hypothetical protein